MKLFYFQAHCGNFGDDLNPWLWSRIWPDLENAPYDWLIGIGTILDARIDKLDGTKLVMGSGFRPTTLPAASFRNTWVKAVRGPLTAQAMELDESLAITDPAILVCNFFERKASPGNPIGFLPHFATAEAFNCKQLAEDAGMIYIDPRNSPASVIECIRSMDRVVVEAMHGAIVADALGIPWRRVRLFSWKRESEAVSEFKWNDWLRSVEMSTAPADTCKIHRQMGKGRRRRLLNAFYRSIDQRNIGHFIKHISTLSGFVNSNPRVRASKVDQFLTCIERVRSARAF